ncbi:MAG: hypothetical protein ACXAB7_16710 [Candidatus Kariarchaeaceae archaeon]|jgi:hypothetical protein
MSTKRERMRKKAQLELRKRDPDAETGLPAKEEKSTKDKPPTLASGFWMILLGSTVMVILFTMGQWWLGVIAGGAFTFIGSMRITKATARSSNTKLHGSE